MKVYITDKVSWKKHPSKELELRIGTDLFAGVKPHKDGYLMYETTPDFLKKQLLELVPALNISPANL